MTGMTESRNRMVWQLILIFTYPFVYILTWSIPFIMHTMGLDNASRRGDVFWLDVLATASLAGQGAADCLVFMQQEKPWRHVRGSFWSSLNERLGLRQRLSLSLSLSSPLERRYYPGRTKEEMDNDERLARQRRNEEIAHEKADQLERVQAAPGQRKTSRKGGEDWWDQFDERE